MIFDDLIRTSEGPKLNIESDFEFMNRSARPEIAQLRGFLEGLVSEFPQPKEMVSRFRSKCDSQYRSAEFELLLFGMLNRSGYRLEPHPDLSNGAESRPDFAVTSPDGEEFFLEAVLANESYGEPASVLAETTLDVLSTTSHPFFGVIVEWSGSATTQPSRKKFKRDVLSWLDSLHADDVRRRFEDAGHSQLPKMSWRHEQLLVSLKAYPWAPDQRGKSHRLLAMQHSGASWIDSWTPMRDAIRQKGMRYGVLNKPLVVAVNFCGHRLDRIDEMQALFGQEQVVLSTDPVIAPRQSRARNGAWIGNAGPQGRRVSAAWFFDNLGAHRVPSCRTTLYLHPWADHALSSALREFSTAVVVDDVVQWRTGLSFGSVFRLPPAWPFATSST